MESEHGIERNALGKAHFALDPYRLVDPAWRSRVIRLGQEYINSVTKWPDYREDIQLELNLMQSLVQGTLKPEPSISGVFRFSFDETGLDHVRLMSVAEVMEDVYKEWEASRKSARAPGFIRTYLSDIHLQYIISQWPAVCVQKDSITDVWPREDRPKRKVLDQFKIASREFYGKISKGGFDSARPEVLLIWELETMFCDWVLSRLVIKEDEPLDVFQIPSLGPGIARYPFEVCTYYTPDVKPSVALNEYLVAGGLLAVGTRACLLGKYRIPGHELAKHQIRYKKGETILRLINKSRLECHNAELRDRKELHKELMRTLQKSAGAQSLKELQTSYRAFSDAVWKTMGLTDVKFNHSLGYSEFRCLMHLSKFNPLSPTYSNKRKCIGFYVHCREEYISDKKKPDPKANKNSGIRRATMAVRGGSIVTDRGILAVIGRILERTPEHEREASLHHIIKYLRGQGDRIPPVLEGKMKDSARVRLCIDMAEEEKYATLLSRKVDEMGNSNRAMCSIGGMICDLVNRERTQVQNALNSGRSIGVFKHGYKPPDGADTDVAQVLTQICAGRVEALRLWPLGDILQLVNTCMESRELLPLDISAVDDLVVNLKELVEEPLRLEYVKQEAFDYLQSFSSSGDVDDRVKISLAHRGLKHVDAKVNPNLHNIITLLYCCDMDSRVPYIELIETEDEQDADGDEQEPAGGGDNEADIGGTPVESYGWTLAATDDDENEDLLAQDEPEAEGGEDAEAHGSRDDAPPPEDGDPSDDSESDAGDAKEGGESKAKVKEFLDTEAERDEEEKRDPIRDEDNVLNTFDSVTDEEVNVLLGMRARGFKSQYTAQFGLAWEGPAKVRYDDLFSSQSIAAEVAKRKFYPVASYVSLFIGENSVPLSQGYLTPKQLYLKYLKKSKSFNSGATMRFHAMCAKVVWWISQAASVQDGYDRMNRVMQKAGERTLDMPIRHMILSSVAPPTQDNSDRQSEIATMMMGASADAVAAVMAVLVKSKNKEQRAAEVVAEAARITGKSELDAGFRPMFAYAAYFLDVKRSELETNTMQYSEIYASFESALEETPTMGLQILHRLTAPIMWWLRNLDEAVFKQQTDMILESNGYNRIGWAEDIAEPNITGVTNLQRYVAYLMRARAVDLLERNKQVFGESGAVSFRGLVQRKKLYGVDSLPVPMFVARFLHDQRDAIELQKVGVSSPSSPSRKDDDSPVIDLLQLYRDNAIPKEAGEEYPRYYGFFVVEYLRHLPRGNMLGMMNNILTAGGYSNFKLRDRLGVTREDALEASRTEEREKKEEQKRLQEEDEERYKSMGFEQRFEELKEELQASYTQILGVDADEDEHIDDKDKAVLEKYKSEAHPYMSIMRKGIRAHKSGIEWTKKKQMKVAQFRDKAIFGKILTDLLGGLEREGAGQVISKVFTAMEPRGDFRQFITNLNKLSNYLKEGDVYDVNAAVAKRKQATRSRKPGKEEESDAGNEEDVEEEGEEQEQEQDAEDPDAVSRRDMASVTIETTWDRMMEVFSSYDKAEKVQTAEQIRLLTQMHELAKLLGDREISEAEELANSSERDNLGIAYINACNAFFAHQQYVLDASSGSHTDPWTWEDEFGRDDAILQFGEFFKLYEEGGEDLFAKDEVLQELKDEFGDTTPMYPLAWKIVQGVNKHGFRDGDTMDTVLKYLHGRASMPVSYCTAQRFVRALEKECLDKLLHVNEGERNKAIVKAAQNLGLALSEDVKGAMERGPSVPVPEQPQQAASLEIVPVSSTPVETSRTVNKRRTIESDDEVDFSANAAQSSGPGVSPDAAHTPAAEASPLASVARSPGAASTPANGASPPASAARSPGAASTPASAASPPASAASPPASAAQSPDVAAPSADAVELTPTPVRSEKLPNFNTEKDLAPFLLKHIYSILLDFKNGMEHVIRTLPADADESIRLRLEEYSKLEEGVQDGFLRSVFSDTQYNDQYLQVKLRRDSWAIVLHTHISTIESAPELEGHIRKNAILRSLKHYNVEDEYRPLKSLMTVRPFLDYIIRMRTGSGIVTNAARGEDATAFSVLLQALEFEARLRHGILFMYNPPLSLAKFPEDAKSLPWYKVEAVMRILEGFPAKSRPMLFEAWEKLKSADVGEISRDEEPNRFALLGSYPNLRILLEFASQCRIKYGKDEFDTVVITFCEILYGIEEQPSLSEKNVLGALAYLRGLGNAGAIRGAITGLLTEVGMDPAEFWPVGKIRGRFPQTPLTSVHRMISTEAVQMAISVLSSNSGMFEAAQDCKNPTDAIQAIRGIGVPSTGQDDTQSQAIRSIQMLSLQEWKVCVAACRKALELSSVSRMLRFESVLDALPDVAKVTKLLTEGASIPPDLLERARGSTYKRPLIGVFLEYISIQYGQHGKSLASVAGPLEAGTDLDEAEKVMHEYASIVFRQEDWRASLYELVEFAQAGHKDTYPHLLERYRSQNPAYTPWRLWLSELSCDDLIYHLCVTPNGCSERLLEESVGLGKDSGIRKLDVDCLLEMGTKGPIPLASLTLDFLLPNWQNAEFSVEATRVREGLTQHEQILKTHVGERFQRAWHQVAHPAFFRLQHVGDERMVQVLREFVQWIRQTLDALGRQEQVATIEASVDNARVPILVETPSPRDDLYRDDEAPSPHVVETFAQTVESQAQKYHEDDTWKRLNMDVTQMLNEFGVAQQAYLQGSKAKVDTKSSKAKAKRGKGKAPRGLRNMMEAVMRTYSPFSSRPVYRNLALRLSKWLPGVKMEQIIDYEVLAKEDVTQALRAIESWIGEKDDVFFEDNVLRPILAWLLRDPDPRVPLALVQNEIQGKEKAADVAKREVTQGVADNTSDVTNPVALMKAQESWLDPQIDFSKQKKIFPISPKLSSKKKIKRVCRKWYYPLYTMLWTRIRHHWPEAPNTSAYIQDGDLPDLANALDGILSDCENVESFEDQNLTIIADFLRSQSDPRIWMRKIEEDISLLSQYTNLGGGVRAPQYAHYLDQLDPEGGHQPFCVTSFLVRHHELWRVLAEADGAGKRPKLDDMAAFIQRWRHGIRVYNHLSDTKLKETAAESSDLNYDGRDEIIKWIDETDNWEYILKARDTYGTIGPWGTVIENRISEKFVLAWTIHILELCTDTRSVGWNSVRTWLTRNAKVRVHENYRHRVISIMNLLSKMWDCWAWEWVKKILDMKPPEGFVEDVPQSPSDLGGGEQIFPVSNSLVNSKPLTGLKPPSPRSASSPFGSPDWSLPTPTFDRRKLESNSPLVSEPTDTADAPTVLRRRIKPARKSRVVGGSKSPLVDNPTMDTPAPVRHVALPVTPPAAAPIPPAGGTTPFLHFPSMTPAYPSSSASAISIASAPETATTPAPRTSTPPEAPAESDLVPPPADSHGNAAPAADTGQGSGQASGASNSVGGGSGEGPTRSGGGHGREGERQDTSGSAGGANKGISPKREKQRKVCRYMKYDTVIEQEGHDNPGVDLHTVQQYKVCRLKEKALLVLELRMIIQAFGVTFEQALDYLGAYAKRMAGNYEDELLRAGELDPAKKAVRMTDLRRIKALRKFRAGRANGFKNEMAYDIYNERLFMYRCERVVSDPSVRAGLSQAYFGLYIQMYRDIQYDRSREAVYMPLATPIASPAPTRRAAQADTPRNASGAISSPEVDRMLRDLDEGMRNRPKEIRKHVAYIQEGEEPSRLAGFNSDIGRACIAFARACSYQAAVIAVERERSLKAEQDLDRIFKSVRSPYAAEEGDDPDSGDDLYQIQKWALRYSQFLDDKERTQFGVGLLGMCGVGSVGELKARSLAMLNDRITAVQAHLIKPSGSITPPASIHGIVDQALAKAFPDEAIQCATDEMVYPSLLSTGWAVLHLAGSSVDARAELHTLVADLADSQQTQMQMLHTQILRVNQGLDQAMVRETPWSRLLVSKTTRAIESMTTRHQQMLKITESWRKIATESVKAQKGAEVLCHRQNRELASTIQRLKKSGDRVQKALTNFCNTQDVGRISALCKELELERQSFLGIGKVQVPDIQLDQLLLEQGSIIPRDTATAIADKVRKKVRRFGDEIARKLSDAAKEFRGSAPAQEEIRELRQKVSRYRRFIQGVSGMLKTTRPLRRAVRLSTDQQAYRASQISTYCHLNSINALNAADPNQTVAQFVTARAQQLQEVLDFSEENAPDYAQITIRRLQEKYASLGDEARGASIEYIARMP